MGDGEREESEAHALTLSKHTHPGNKGDWNIGDNNVGNGA